MSCKKITSYVYNGRDTDRLFLRISVPRRNRVFREKMRKQQGVLFVTQKSSKRRTKKAVSFREKYKNYTKTNKKHKTKHKTSRRNLL